MCSDSCYHSVSALYIFISSATMSLSVISGLKPYWLYAHSPVTFFIVSITLSLYLTTSAITTFSIARI